MEEKELVHEAVTRYNSACDTLLCRVAESYSCSLGEGDKFSGRMQEFEADCQKMRQIMEEYEAYVDKV